MQATVKCFKLNMLHDFRVGQLSHGNVPEPGHTIQHRLVTGHQRVKAY